MEWYWIVLIIIAIMLAVAGCIGLIAYSINKVQVEFTGSPLGGPCTFDTGCIGWGLSVNDTKCCGGICTQKKADWTGNAPGECPGDCRGCPGCPLGSCGPPYGATAGVGGQAAWHWPRELGEPCGLPTDCLNHGIGLGDVGCCNGYCETVALDYLGVGYCPNECRGCFACPVGTCGDWHTPRKQGEPCTIGADEQCEGWSLFGDVACCNYRCVTKDETVQTCSSFCNNHPDICSAPYPS